MAKVTIPYRPRDWQQTEHNNLARFTVLVLHRRAGKTHFAVNQLIKEAFNTSKKRPQVAYIAPTYRQAKQVSWDIFKQMLAGVPKVKFNESELRIDLPNGGRILVLGAETPDSLRGLYLDYAVLDEVADMPANLWTAVIRPALADRVGGALFIGTPKGKNFFHELYLRGKFEKEWRSTLLTWKETGALTDEEVASLRKELSPEEFDQELECSFTAAIRGAYFGKNMAKAESSGRICDVSYNPDYPVIASWDIGFDGTAIWYAQSILNDINFIDFDVFEDEDIPAVLKVVKNKPYVYDYQILPHDAQHRSKHDKRKTIRSQIETMGLKCIVAEKIDLANGINEARRLIDRARFNMDKCSKGLESLRQYRANYDEAKGVLQQTPVHDKHSHPADSFRYMAIGIKGPSSMANKAPRIFSDYNPYSLNHDAINQWDIYNTGY